MEIAIQIGLTNIAVAALLAIVAAAASLIRSRPALAHALWFLVILKLLTPPLWDVQIDRRWARAVQPTLEQSMIERSREVNAPVPAAAHEPAAPVMPGLESATWMSDEAQAEYESPKLETVSPTAVAPPPPP